MIKRVLICFLAVTIIIVVGCNDSTTDGNSTEEINSTIKAETDNSTTDSSTADEKSLFSVDGRKHTIDNLILTLPDSLDLKEKTVDSLTYTYKNDEHSLITVKAYDYEASLSNSELVDTLVSKYKNDEMVKEYDFRTKDCKVTWTEKTESGWVGYKTEEKSYNVTYWELSYSCFNDNALDSIRTKELYIPSENHLIVVTIQSKNNLDEMFSHTEFKFKSTPPVQEIIDTFDKEQRICGVKFNVPLNAEKKKEQDVTI